MMRLMGRPQGVRRARSKRNWQPIAVKELRVAVLWESAFAPFGSYGETDFA